MNKVVQFVPRADLEAKENLETFIRMAREDLTAFGAESSAWEKDRWQEGKVVAVFATKTAPLSSYVFTPFADPFRQFAKAFIRYRYSHRPVVSVAVWIQGLRCIEAALRSTGSADIARLNGALMDLCAQKCREFFPNPEVAHKTGLSIKATFDFCRDMGFVSSLPRWESPFRKPTILTEDLTAEGKEHRDGKMPSNENMLMLADLFAGAATAEEKYFTAILILLMATPSRISEVMGLSTDCIHWEEDDSGTRQMYLRWRAAKGKGAMKKWVVPAMHSVVIEAIRSLVEIGEPARRAAQFAFENPGVFMRHPECTTKPAHAEDTPLGPAEFCAAMGLKIPERVKIGSETWSQVQGATARALVRDGHVTYRQMARYTVEQYSNEIWPLIDMKSGVKIWDALCLHREFEFHQDFSVRPFSWRLPRTTEINDRLYPDKGLSLFERRGLRNPDGSPVELTTHQLRHWLSTMCERAGMDEYTLAQWAGRADPKHNRNYDHRTPAERLAAARHLLPGGKPSLLERFATHQPVTYQELGVDRLGTAKATLYGMCTHDYTMAPCQKQRECMICKEHICIKGDHVTQERLQVLEVQTEGLLLKAQQAHQDGLFGADRWVDNHKWKLAHVRSMRMAMENPEVPAGALLRIPDGHDPSPVRRTLNGLGLVKPSASDTDGIVLALPAVKAADA